MKELDGCEMANKKRGSEKKSDRGKHGWDKVANWKHNLTNNGNALGIVASAQSTAVYR